MSNFERRIEYILFTRSVLQKLQSFIFGSRYIPHHKIHKSIRKFFIPNYLSFQQDTFISHMICTHVGLLPSMSNTNLCKVTAQQTSFTEQEVPTTPTITMKEIDDIYDTPSNIIICSEIIFEIQIIHNSRIFVSNTDTLAIGTLSSPTRTPILFHANPSNFHVQSFKVKLKPTTRGKLPRYPSRHMKFRYQICKAPKVSKLYNRRDDEITFSKLYLFNHHNLSTCHLYRTKTST